MTEYRQACCWPFGYPKLQNVISSSCACYTFSPLSFFSLSAFLVLMMETWTLRRTKSTLNHTLLSFTTHVLLSERRCWRPTFRNKNVNIRLGLRLCGWHWLKPEILLCDIVESEPSRRFKLCKIDFMPSFHPGVCHLKFVMPCKRKLQFVAACGC